MNPSLLLSFYFVTFFFSTVSGVASFLLIENRFHQFFFLCLALSLRTFSGFIFGYYCNHIIRYFGIYHSIILSQLFSVIALSVLYLGFHFNYFSITLLGLMLTILPAVFASILLSIIFKTNLEDERKFRKYSSNRELLAGIAGISGAILSPLLLLKFNLGTIIAISAIGQVSSVFFILRISTEGKVKLRNYFAPKNVSLNQFILKKEVIQFLLKTTASLLLAGLVPLIASSKKIYLTNELPSLIRQELWAVDQIAIILASALYIYFMRLIKHPIFTIILMLNGIWLAFPLLFFNPYIIMFAIIIACVSLQISFQRFRDDLILSAHNNSELIHGYAAISSAQKSLIYFLSPLFLGVLFGYHFSVTIIGILIAQSILLASLFIFNKSFANKNIL